MTKTQNYNLNQWEPTDPIRREDFNADNAAIDAALKEAAGSRPYVIGTYIGTSDTTKTTSVELGFRPSAVLIKYPMDSYGTYGTLFTVDCPVTYQDKVYAYVTDTGFIVSHILNNNTTIAPFLNTTRTYVYIAFR